MRITINNQDIDLSSDYLTIAELMKERGVKAGGTAIALNNKIVKHENWEITRLHDGDSVTIISAAFGG
jgi:thiamine biosynthesis protein thiS